MKEAKRKWDLLSDEKRKSCMDGLIAFFKEERGETIGVIAAGAILDFILQQTAEDIYSRGINDAKKLMQQRYYDLDVELDLLLGK